MSLKGALTITNAVRGDTKAKKNAGQDLSEIPTTDSAPKDGCPSVTHSSAPFKLSQQMTGF